MLPQIALSRYSLLRAIAARLDHKDFATNDVHFRLEDDGIKSACGHYNILERSVKSLFTATNTRKLTKDATVV